MQRATLMQSYSMTYDKTWLIYIKINVKFTYSEYQVIKALLRMKKQINWSKALLKNYQLSTTWKQSS